MLPKSLVRTCSRLMILTIPVAIFGCSGTIPRTDVLGRYRVNYDYGIEELTLREDGTYVQDFAEKDQQLRTINTGRWDIQRGDFWEGQLLNLFEPVIVDVSGRRSDLARRSGKWMIRIRKTWSGQPRLLINDDLGEAFERVQ
jgi:hypothetical protein